MRTGSVRVVVLVFACSLLSGSQTWLAGRGAAATVEPNPRPEINSAAPGVRNTSYEVLGERVLRQEVIVPSDVKRVWRAFTTVEGLRAWAAPVVEFELKTGGKFHSNYRPDAKIGDPGSIYNTVLSYIPLKMLTFKIGLTQAFPEGPRQEGTLFAVAEFERIGKNTTRVSLSMAGWGKGEDWNKVYQFFDRNNPTALMELRESFVTGPIDWRKGEAPSQGKD